MIKPVKRFYPTANPLPKIKIVRTYVTRYGKVIQSYRRRPKFRKGVVIGYR